MNFAIQSNLIVRKRIISQKQSKIWVQYRLYCTHIFYVKIKSANISLFGRHFFKDKGCMLEYTALCTALYTALCTELCTALHNALHTAHCTALLTQLCTEFFTAMCTALYIALWTALCTSVFTALCTALWTSLWTALFTALCTALCNALWTAVWTSVCTALFTALHCTSFVRVSSFVGVSISRFVNIFFSSFVFLKESLALVKSCSSVVRALVCQLNGPGSILAVLFKSAITRVNQSSCGQPSLFNRDIHAYFFRLQD